MTTKKCVKHLLTIHINSIHGATVAPLCKPHVQVLFRNGLLKINGKHQISFNVGRHDSAGDDHKIFRVVLRFVEYRAYRVLLKHFLALPFNDDLFR